MEEERKSYLRSKMTFLLRHIKEIVSQAEELKMTNEQQYIDWENELNRLSVKDHNK